jgi:ubiquinone/menaquinone biosynthesis C-methylase UbiE
LTKSAKINFGDIDQSGSERETVALTDLIRRHPAIQDFTQRGLHLLELRPGQRVLDVGCGTGENVREFSGIVGSSGFAAGIDRSEAMIAEARRRSAEQNETAVSYRVGEAANIDFADGSFDVCWTERMLQHVSHPERVIAEMIRVLKPGGRLAVLETDWETFTMDLPDVESTRKVLNLFCDNIQNGWIGRQLLRLVRRAGLTEIKPFYGVVPGNNFRELFDALGMGEIVDTLQAANLLSAAEAAAWQQSLDAADRDGNSFYSITLFGICATKTNA